MMEVAEEWDILLLSHLCWESDVQYPSGADMEVSVTMFQWLMIISFTSVSFSNLMLTEQRLNTIVNLSKKYHILITNRLTSTNQINSKRALPVNKSEVV